MTGAFFFKNVQAGRCLDENGVEHLGRVAPADLGLHNNGANQKWNINAYPSN